MRVVMCRDVTGQAEFGLNDLKRPAVSLVGKLASKFTARK